MFRRYTELQLWQRYDCTKHKLILEDKSYWNFIYEHKGFHHSDRKHRILVTGRGSIKAHPGRQLGLHRAEVPYHFDLIPPIDL